MNPAEAAPRLARLLRACILTQCLLFAVFVAGSYNVFVRLPRPTTTDFSSFYAAGVLADRGDARGAYDIPTHRAVEEQATAPGIDYKYFLNPPPFLLICAPLAALPYLLAFLLFEAMSFWLWFSIASRIAGGGPLARLGLLAWPALYWALGWGQNSFLTSGLMGLGTLLLRDRPGLAGMAFGALCIKPHFGVLIPVALLCGRRWRAAATAAATVAVLAGLSALMFGGSAWRAFLSMALHARATIESGKIQLAGHIDPGGAARLLGAGPTAGWAIQGLASLAAAGVVAWAWLGRQRDSASLHEARMAALVAGTVVAMPFLLFYDLVLASMAAAWIFRSAQRTGWLPAEALTIGLSMGLILLAFPAAALLHLALGTLVGPLLLGLAVRRVAAAVRV